MKKKLTVSCLFTALLLFNMTSCKMLSRTDADPKYNDDINSLTKDLNDSISSLNLMIKDLLVQKEDLQRRYSESQQVFDQYDSLKFYYQQTLDELKSIKQHPEVWNDSIIDTYIYKNAALKLPRTNFNNGLMTFKGMSKKIESLTKDNDEKNQDFLRTISKLRKSVDSLQSDNRELHNRLETAIVENSKDTALIAAMTRKIKENENNILNLRGDVGVLTQKLDNVDSIGLSCYIELEHKKDNRFIKSKPGFQCLSKNLGKIFVYCSVSDMKGMSQVSKSRVKVYVKAFYQPANTNNSGGGTILLNEDRQKKTTLNNQSILYSLEQDATFKGWQEFEIPFDEKFRNKGTVEITIYTDDESHPVKMPLIKLQ